MLEVREMRLTEISQDAGAPSKPEALHVRLSRLANEADPRAVMLSATTAMRNMRIRGRRG